MISWHMPNWVWSLRLDVGSRESVQLVQRDETNAMAITRTSEKCPRATQMPHMPSEECIQHVLSIFLRTASLFGDIKISININIDII